jgi:hypothetical protein
MAHCACTQMGMDDCDRECIPWWEWESKELPGEEKDNCSLVSLLMPQPQGWAQTEGLLLT